MVKQFKQVDKKQFLAFVKSYPNELRWDVNRIHEPPQGSYNDFTGGLKWPDSMVAKVWLYDGGDYHGGKNREYFIEVKEDAS